MNIVTMKLSLYCTDCNLLLKVGESAIKIDGATFKHVTCPSHLNMRHFAAHKQPNTGMHFGVDETTE